MASLAPVGSCALCSQPYDGLDHKKVELHSIAKEVHALCMACLKDLVKTKKSSGRDSLKTCPFCSAEFKKVGVSDVANKVLGIGDSNAKRSHKGTHSPRKKERVADTVLLLTVPEVGLPPILKEDFLEIQAALDIFMDRSAEPERVEKAWKQLGMFVPENCRGQNHLITQSLLLRLKDCTPKHCPDLDGIILAFEALKEQRPLESIPKQEASPLTKGPKV